MALRFAPLVVCTFLGLASAWQMYALPHAPGEDYSIAQVLLWRHVPWQIWLAGMPLAVAIQRRWGSTWKSRARATALHLLLLAALSVAGELLIYQCGRLAGIEPYLTYDVGSIVPSMLIKGSLFSMLVYGAVLVGHAAYEYRRCYQEAGARLARAQLFALKMQLHPHFLFNTLNSVAVLVRKGDGALALRMLSGLAELLRYSLRTMKVELVPLRDELDFIRRYLDIQTVRFSDRLTVSIEVDPDVEEARVPSLITQPIVENAIKHGASRRAGPSRLEIVALAEPDRLRIEVRDDGPGPDAPPAAPEDGNGVGLAHVHDRLAQLYPGRHAFTLEPREDGGTTAVLELPLELG